MRSFTEMRPLRACVGRASRAGDLGPDRAGDLGSARAGGLRQARAREERCAGTERRFGSEGFLLLEAVIALAIIGIVAVGVLASTASQVRTADKASVLAVARTLAEDRTTSFRFLGYDELRAPPDSLLAGTFPFPFDEFSWTAAIRETEGEYDLFTLDIVMMGRGEVFPLQTLLHKPRPQIAVGAQAGGGAGRGGGAAAGPGGGRGAQDGTVGPGGGRAGQGGGTGRGGGRGTGGGGGRGTGGGGGRAGGGQGGGRGGQ